MDLAAAARTSRRRDEVLDEGGAPSERLVSRKLQACRPALLQRGARSEQLDSTRDGMFPRQGLTPAEGRPRAQKHSSRRPSFWTPNLTPKTT